MSTNLILNIKYFEKEKSFTTLFMNLKEKKKINYIINYNRILNIIEDKLNLEKDFIQEIKLMDETSRLYNKIDENFEVNFKDLKENKLNLYIIKKDNKLSKMSIKDFYENIQNLKYEMKERFKNINKNYLNLKFIVALILKDTNILQNKEILEYLEEFIQANKLEDNDIMKFLNLSEEKDISLNKEKRVNFSNSVGSYKNLSFNKFKSEIYPKSNSFLDENMINLLLQASNKAYNEINLKNNKKDFKFEKTKNDFQIIYSNPLIRKVAKNSKLDLKIGELNYNSVDYNSECNKIVEIIETSKLNLKVSIDCANYEKFIQKIKESPKILHVICHGDIYDEEYSLQLEGNEGELYSLSVNKLREFLKNYKLNINLVFINACQSEHMGKLFLESGAECVVCVNSLMNIADNYAKLFSEKFYNLLIKNKETINESFHNSKLFMEDETNKTLNCCCGHLHKLDCPWFESKMGHESHIPTCNCAQKNKYIHESYCNWAEDFLFNYAKDDLDYNVNNNVICCCSPELPHDENLKLKLLYKDDNIEFGNQRIFENDIKGKVNYEKNYNFKNIRFGEVNAKGQNINLYNLYNLVQKKRVVICKGSKGSGKTYLIKHLTKYLEERNIFGGIIYLVKEEVNKINDLLLTILNKMNISFKINNKNNISEELKKGYGNSKILVIINNLEDRSESLNCFLKFFMDETSVNFWISTNSNEKFKEDVLDLEEYIMKAMTFNMAQYLLYENLPNIPYIDLIDIKNKLLKKHKYPKEILKLAKIIEDNYKNNIPVNEIQYLLSKDNTMLGSENGDISVLSHESYNQNILKFFKIYEHIDVSIKNKEVELVLFFLIFLPDSLILNIHLDIINKFLNEFNIYEVIGLIKEVPQKFNNLEEYINNIKSKFEKKSKNKIIKNNNFSIYLEKSKYDQKEYFKLKLSGIIKKKIRNLSLLKDYSYLSFFFKKFIYFVIELSNNWIKYFKSNNIYYESTSELSSISKYGNWNLIKFNKNNNFIQNLNENEIKLLNDNYIENIKKFVEDFSSNCFKGFINYLYNRDNNIDKEILIESTRLLEDLIIKLITVLKINNSYKKEIYNIVDYFLDLFISIDKNFENLFYNLLSKLYLLKWWYYYKIIREDKNEDISEHLMNNLFFEVKNYIQNNFFYTKEKYNFLGEFWIIFLKYLRISNSDIEYPNEILIVMNELKKSKASMILYSKFCLENFRYNYKITKINEDLKLEMINAIKNLDHISYLKIKMYGLYYYIKYFILNPGAVKNYIQEFKNIKQKIENDNLLEKYLKKWNKIKNIISKKIKNNFIFKFSKNILKIDNSLIRKNYLKNSLTKFLEDKDLSINIEFSRLNNNNFLKFSDYNFGCKIYSMIIQNYSSLNSIVMEDGKLNLISVKNYDFFNLFIDNINNKNRYIEILILGFLCSEEIIKKLTQIEVPYIFYFNFKTNIINKNSIFEKFLIETYIYKFCLYFSKEILKENSVLKSFNMVKAKLNNKMRYLLNDKFKIFNIKIIKNKIITEEFEYLNFIKAFGEGVKWLTNEKYKTNFINTDFFKKGDYNDISPYKDKTFNTTISNDNFIGRSNEMKFLIDSILKFKKKVWIYGNKGNGKTKLALEFAYNLYKNNYFKDGYFYFDLKKLSNENDSSDIVDLIQSEFKMDENLDFYSNLQNKDMLIILDGFEIIKTKKKLIYPYSLIKSIVENKINLIIISESKLTFENYQNEFNLLEIKKLSKENIIYYLQLKLIFDYKIVLLFEEKLIQYLLNHKFFENDYSPNSLNSLEIQNIFYKEVLNIDIVKRSIYKNN